MRLIFVDVPAMTKACEDEPRIYASRLHQRRSHQYCISLDLLGS